MDDEKFPDELQKRVDMLQIQLGKGKDDEGRDTPIILCLECSYNGDEKWMLEFPYGTGHQVSSATALSLITAANGKNTNFENTFYYLEDD